MATTKTRPQSVLFGFRTNPLVHATVHGVRRRLGRREIGRLVSEARNDVERAVTSALRDALNGEPTAAPLQRIEDIREEYLRSTVTLPGAQTGKVKTLAGAASVSKPRRDAWMLNRVVEALRPAVALETGTCVGISASYLAAALPADGRLISFELFPTLAEQSEQTLRRADVADKVEVVVGDVADTLPTALEKLPQIDFAFIDGGHNRTRVNGDTDRILTRATAKTVIVYDDIRWSADMKLAWGDICADDRFSLVVDLGSMGIAVYGPDLPKKIVRLHWA